MKTFHVLAVSIAAALTMIHSSPLEAQNDTILKAVHSAETTLGARVGVAIYDAADGKSWLYHANDRFPMASTYKTLACAALLEAGLMTHRVVVGKDDIQSYAPVTKTMVGQSVSASDLCAITLRTSDNTAANKVIEVLGGPSSVTGYLRTIGDKTTRLDRLEPDLNESQPGDMRDTTTPQAMAETIRKLLLGTALDPMARDQLTEWMIADDIAGSLLRAAIPADWRIADKTGGGGHGTRGIVAVIWPPKHEPVAVVIYLTETEASMEARNAAIADIGKAIVAQLLN